MRVAFDTIIGLDYNVIFKLFDMYKVDDDDREYYLRMLKIIEGIYLESLEEKRKKSNKQSNNKDTNYESKTIGRNARN